MSGWILSIVGMVMMVTLVEIMLPEGQTAKYVKGVVSLMVVYVVLLPIPQIIHAKIDINTFFDFSEERYQIDSSFIQIINEDKQSVLSERMNERFLSEGLSAKGSVILGAQGEIEYVVLTCLPAQEDLAVLCAMETLGVKEDRIVIHEVAT